MAALELLLLGFLGVLAAVGIPKLWQSPRTPLALWIAGWISASISGLLFLLRDELRWLGFLTFPLGTLFPWLILAGTLAWRDRPATRPIVAVALVLGAARAALAAAVGPGPSYALALAVEPAAVLAAAWVAWQAPKPPGGLRLGRTLAVSLVVLALAGAAHVFTVFRGVGPLLPLLAIWVVATPVLLGLQVQAGGAWARRELERARDELERRVAERTAELAQANASLREGELRWRTVSELGSDLSFAYRVAADGRVTVEWTTDAALRLTGYEVEELRRSRPRVIHPADRRRLTDILFRAEGGDFDCDFRIVRKDGEVRWLDTRFRVERDEPDGSTRILGAARDVTEARQAEDAHRRFERQAQESQRLESLGLLTGGIAHDSNNLLTVILGNTRLALTDLAGDSPLERRLLRIRAAAEHGAALTEQMLVYAGRSSHVRKPKDLSLLVADMLELLRASLPSRCQLRHELPADVWGELDDTQLRQVLLNLVTNAGESLGDAAGSVTVRTGKLGADRAALADARGAPDPEPGSYVFLDVVDDGPGMDAETQRRVFDPFFSTKFSGRGLGLAAVLGIVRGHGGVVKLTSGRGHGTCFRVLLPSAGELLVPEHGKPPEAETPAPARSGRVLVVDDEDAVLEIAEEFLAREGFDAVTAGSGREAVRTFAADPLGFDAAVIDLAMPDLSGERVAAEIRALRPALPLVLASGFSAELAAARCLELGAARFLHKPYEPDDLVRAVHSVLAAESDPDSSSGIA